MHKKYVFVDLDGTVIDHSNETIPESTRLAIKTAKENGHEVFICTGRPPCLFYGIDKELDIDSYIAANGRVLVYKNELLYSDTLDVETMKRVASFAKEKQIDLAFQGFNDFKIQSTYNDNYIKFSKHYNIEVPELETDFYLDNDVYQMTLYYYEKNFTNLQNLFPELSFAFSCEYGIDVNTKGGLKEKSIKEFIEMFNIDPTDVIAIGDGHNDISMLQYVHMGVAMGNADDEVKKHANFVTDHVSNDGVYKAFKTLKLI